MTNSELVQYLANGYNSTEIAALTNLPVTTIDKKIRTVKKMVGCKNIGHLVAEFFRKQLIQ